MRILVIDGQGGSIGRQLVKLILERFPGQEVVAVGANSIATANMLKAGPISAATGENAVLVACRKADLIVGPIGIVLADAFLGEITPAMAAAVGSSDATRVLLPMNKCNTWIAGCDAASAGALLEDAMQKIARLIAGREES